MRFSYIIPLITLLLAGSSHHLLAQNINGFRIIVGKDAPAYLVFNDEVKSFEFNSTDGYKYYDIIRRSGNALSIAFRQSAIDAPPPQISIVMEGKRTHSFQIQLDEKYDINKSPQLFYDYSNLKELKTLLAQGKSQTESNQSAHASLEEEAQQEKKEAELTKAKKEEAAEAKKQKAANEAKIEAAAQKEKEKEIARLKEEQTRLDAERKLAEMAAAKEQARLKNQAEQQAKKDALQEKKLAEERLAKEAETKKLEKSRQEEEKKLAAQLAKEKELKRQELQRIQDVKEREKKELEAQKAIAEKEQKAEDARKKEDARIAAVQKAEAEKLRLEEAKRKENEIKQEQRRLKEEENLRQQQAALAKKKEEEADAAARLAQLEAERAAAQQNERYSSTGLWERYGSKGINLYDLPPEQHQLNNAEFYLEKDTFRHYTVSEQMIADATVIKENIKSNTVNAVTATLLDIRLTEGSVFYEMLVENNSKEDFLQGAMGMYWFDKDEQPKKWINCSYYTYIAGLNIIRPGEKAHVVYATRLITIPVEDKLVLMLQDRRPGSEKLNLIISGNIYNQHIAKSAIDHEEPVPINHEQPKKQKRKSGK